MTSSAITQTIDYRDLATQYADTFDTDLVICNAAIERPLDRKVIEMTANRPRRANVCLLLTTEGGDPDAAYRISRCLQSRYERFSVLIGGYCKSAGTLMALGANELVFSDQGELGPIDVQMSKKDELWEFQSGLTVNTALHALHEKAFLAFEHFFMKIKADSDGTVTLKTATEVAAKLTSGLFGPIYSHIDPLHVGEAGRAMTIARQYGMRLGVKAKNLRKETLDRLISGYSTHGFVIDYDEARNLFVNVRKTSEAEQAIVTLLGDQVCVPGATPVIDYLCREKQESSYAGESDVPEQQTVHGSGDSAATAGEGVEGGGVAALAAVAGEQ